VGGGESKGRGNEKASLQKKWGKRVLWKAYWKKKGGNKNSGRGKGGLKGLELTEEEKRESRCWGQLVRGKVDWGQNEP